MRKIKKKYIWWGIGAVALIVLIIALSGGKASAFETDTVALTDVVADIEVTGKIAPFEKADLSFESVGAVSYIGVKVGDVVKKGQLLGSLDTREARASYQSAQANVLAEQARLDEMEKGTRVEELSISGVAFTNKGRELVNSARDTFARLDTALHSSVDTLYENGDTYNPQVVLNTSNRERKNELNSLRIALNEALETWSDTYATTNTSVDEVSQFTRDTLSKAKKLVDLLWLYAKEPTAEQRTTILAAQSDIAAISKDFITAQTTYDSAKGDYVLKRSGNTTDSVQAQRAKVEQSLADAANKEAVLSKMSIVAPFDGIVTVVEPVMGETVSANTVAFSVMTAGAYKIEVFVPESNIAKVSEGNVATVALDAYGDSATFTATVIKIDPAETIVEGIPTYKVTLSIDSDPRIRSGMTADITIVSARKEQVRAVPTRALIDKQGKIFVRKVTGDTYAEYPVEIGLKGSNGYTEVLGGIEVGETVVTSLK